MTRRQPCMTAATANVAQPIYKKIGVRKVKMQGKRKGVVGEGGRTSPICAFSESDTGDHEYTSWSLNQHHGYTQSSNEFRFIRV